MLAPFVGQFLLGNLTLADPWLGRIGLTVVGVVYALGAGLVFWGNYYEERFLASPGQLSGIGIITVSYTHLTLPTILLV